MKNFFGAFLWFLVLALIALVLHYFVGEKLCGVCDNSNAKPNKELVNPAPATQTKLQLSEFTITDTSGKSIFKFPRGFIINSNNGAVEIPSSVVGIKDSIFEYLNNNQGKELIISAKYLEKEGEPRGFDRANFLKNILTEAGVNPNRIIPKAVLSDYSYDKDNKYTEGVAMVFQNIPEEQMRLIEEGIANKTLYSKFASTEFKPDRNLQGYAFELKSYLVKYPDKHVSVTGHTDNVGNASANYNLGLKRAKNVVGYLIEIGISENQIKAFSKGETLPIASNETEEGRAKNRRINIVVK